VISCETKLLIVDDLHFLSFRTTREGISNQFKYISNEFPLTIVFIGIGLRERGLYSDGPYAEEVLGQSGRRITGFKMRGFSVGNESGRIEWHKLLLAIEQRVVLANAYQGMLAHELSDYLYARSSGRIGSLMTLITRGCLRAIRAGTEVLTKDLLDGIRNDEASERSRDELENALAAGRLMTMPKRPRSRKHLEPLSE